MAVSAFMVAGILVVLDWPTFDRAKGLLIVADLLPRQKSRERAPREVEEVPQPAAPEIPADAEDAVAAPASQAGAVETTRADEQATEADIVDDPRAAAQAPPVVAGEASPAAEQAVDWQAAMERAAAEVIREHNEIVSMHPEFEELRRIAKERYGPAETGKPPPIWENVEQDIYGRTLLWLNDSCYKVLQDTNVGNRYAFETFERHMTFCQIVLGRDKRGRNLPWVDEIVERYPYLRYPDGEIPPPAGE